MGGLLFGLASDGNLKMVLFSCASRLGECRGPLKGTYYGPFHVEIDYFVHYDFYYILWFLWELIETEEHCYDII